MSQVKEQVEVELRRSLPPSLAFELIGLRLGERLTLPDNAILSTMLKNSAAKVHAIIRLNESANHINQNEFTMDNNRGQLEVMRITEKFRLE